MKGSLLQLISLGSENIHININPEITYFKKVYLRYVSFSIETFEIPINNNPNFNTQNTIILKNVGDYLTKIYLCLELPSNENNLNSYWTNRVGFNIIDYISIYIDNFLIEKNTGLWMHIYNNLNNSIDKSKLLDKLVGDNNMKSNKSHKLFIPLSFGFCNNYKSSIPISILGKKRIKLVIKFNSKEKCHQEGSIPLGKIKNVKLLCDYVHISKNFKHDIIQNTQEILYNTVETFKVNFDNNFIKNIKLPFKLPLKEIIIVGRSNKNSRDKFTNFTNINQLELIKSIRLKIDGINVYSKDIGNQYFKNISIFENHKGFPNDGIYCLPFSINPNELQPSGILSLKSIKNINLLIETNEIASIFIFSSSYNLLKFNFEQIIPEYIY